MIVYSSGRRMQCWTDVNLNLLQNIVKSTELQFPPEKKNLNPDCIDLCQKLLRRNPDPQSYKRATSILSRNVEAGHGADLGQGMCLWVELGINLGICPGLI
ncbi:uncharacterized protein LOC130768229 isoform X2 [Actinidia eriantha]|uniref:uncharacterized protein LOC130768229 isoform X2 n=1 Tax=Actinidia eriantha TaxID=165200 RepID=UPI0025883E97|nr:uncharacterized protein LOC130768229 isoform X2 [Actinidia eriantha]